MRSRARLSRWPDIARAALIEHSWLELTLRLAEGRDAIDCDALYGFDIAAGALRPSVVRATGYSCGLGKEAPPEQWRHQSDIGLLSFRFLLAPGNADLPRLAAELEQPPAIVLSPNSDPGPLGRIGSC